MKNNIFIWFLVIIGIFLILSQQGENAGLFSSINTGSPESGYVANYENRWQCWDTGGTWTGTSCDYARGGNGDYNG